MTKIDVTVDRDKYIGGSDIPIIMGISPFRTRYELLLEKAGLQESTFEGNRYTRYGDEMEPKIRAYVNSKYNTNFYPTQVIEGDMRANTDGFNGVKVLEVKTTSHIYETVDEYLIYLVQLLYYIERCKVDAGILAVYERPEDFDVEFDESRLQIFEIFGTDYLGLIREINREIDRFRADVERLKANPLLSEQDFLQSNELVAISQKAVALEIEMLKYKEIEAQYKELKAALYKAMVDADVKSWTMPNGTKITKVKETHASVKLVEEFDVERFKQDHDELYKAYTVEVPKETKGRAGYAKITLPK